METWHIENETYTDVKCEMQRKKYRDYICRIQYGLSIRLHLFSMRLHCIWIFSCIIILYVSSLLYTLRNPKSTLHINVVMVQATCMHGYYTLHCNGISSTFLHFLVIAFFVVHTIFCSAHWIFFFIFDDSIIYNSDRALYGLFLLNNRRSKDKV